MRGGEKECGGEEECGGGRVGKSVGKRKSVGRDSQVQRSFVKSNACAGFQLVCKSFTQDFV